ncbi:unnamed protein product [Diplocarpon coronariae]
MTFEEFAAIWHIITVIGTFLISCVFVTALVRAQWAREAEMRERRSR